MKDLSGDWIWVSTQTDAKPDSTNPATPVNTGIKQQLRFFSNHWYKSVNDVVTDSGTFHTGWKKSDDNEPVKAVYFQRPGIGRDSVECFITYNDTLVFSDMFLGIDGVVTTTWVLQKAQ
jgi:hypothetical protein